MFLINYKFEQNRQLIKIVINRDNQKLNRNAFKILYGPDL